MDYRIREKSLLSLAAKAEVVAAGGRREKGGGETRATFVS